MHSFRLALAPALAAAMAACNASEIGPAGPRPGDGRSAILLTDAPFPFDRIERVDVHIGEIALSTQADTSEGAQGWVVVASPNRVFNLLDLQNGTTALLGEADIPPGQYRAVRMRIDPARSSMTDRNGGHPVIAWQSTADRPTLHSLIQNAMAIDENGEEIVIDFDVGQSFAESGPDDFVFMPYIRAITRAGSGAIAGTLRYDDGGAPIPMAVVSVHMAVDSVPEVGPLVATSRTNAQGEFQASFLPPGRYAVVPEDLDRELVGPVRRVDVRAGETTQAGEFRF